MMATERASVRALLQVPMATVARFAPDGRVWRAFDHLLAVGPGSLALFPVGLMDGDMTRVIDGSPVPWLEAWTAIDAPRGAHVRALTPEGLALESPMAAALLPPYGWVADVVTAGETVPTLRRLVAPCGVRLVWVGCRHD